MMTRRESPGLEVVIEGQEETPDECLVFSDVVGAREFETVGVWP